MEFAHCRETVNFLIVIKPKTFLFLLVSFQKGSLGPDQNHIIANSACMRQIVFPTSSLALYLIYVMETCVTAELPVVYSHIHPQPFYAPSYNYPFPCVGPQAMFPREANVISSIHCSGCGLYMGEIANRSCCFVGHLWTTNEYDSKLPAASHFNPSSHSDHDL